MAKIPRPVWLLGWASLFTDAGTEMIYPLLPIYLSRVLGASAMSLGLIEGVAEGINSVLKIVSGYWSDRARRKPIVVGGYALSSLTRPLIAVTTSWPQVLLIRAIDRTGKGIRGAPRDAMLAQFATPTTRGRVFGFHRAMDHAGAIVGPLVATAILYFAPEQYRLVFGLTIVPGILAVWLLTLVAENDVVTERIVPDGHIATDDRRTPLPSRFWAFLGILFMFSLGNSADAFLLLRLSDALGGVTYIPLLWAGIHLVKSSLSTWGGGLSDRLGRKRVIIVGWGIYAIVYLGFASTRGATGLILWFLLYGTYFGLAEGAEKALIADLSPARRQGTAFGFYNGALGAGTLLASVAFGFVYERFGPATAFGMGSALASAAAVLLMLLRTDVKIVDSNA